MGKMGKVGFDTSFFVELYKKNKIAVKLWLEVTEGEKKGIISMITVFELRRLALRGIISKEFCDALFEAFRKGVCETRELNWEVLEEAAFFSHGTGISAVDSLIYICCKDCTEIYTTDNDFLKAGKKKPKVILIERQ